MSNKYQYVYELWFEYSQKIASSSNEWMNFLKTSAWSYKYRFDDQILIYAQKPNAKTCAEYDTWNMDPLALEKAFELYPDTKVVVIAHLYGTPGKIDELNKIPE